MQHLGGIWTGSFTDISKIRLRQSWHIRCEQANLADCDMGTSSDPQVRHSTSCDGGGKEVVEWRRTDETRDAELV